MTIIDRINETIEEIATERKIDEHSVSWHNIAIRLAKKLNKVENLAIHDVVGRSEQLPDANKHQCNCSNAKDRLDCGFECYNK